MMNYFQKKKLAFMSIVNKVKGFIRTITGELPLTLEGCVDEESIIDYTLYGQSVQNGTPTPETPVEAESVGEYDETTGKYKIPIKVSGKNLLSPQKWVSGEHSDGIIVYPNVNYITSMGENYIEANLAAWQGVASEKFEYAKVNTVGFKINKNQVVDDYTIYYIGLQGYDVDGKKTAFKWLSTSVVADKEYVFKKNYGGFVFGLSTTSVRLCILSRSQAITGLRVYDFYSTNDAETGYEPYHEPITTNIYLDEPLRKVGDYADYIKSVDLKTGKGTVARKVGVNKLLANSNISFTKASTGSSTMNRYFYTPKPVIKSAQTSKGVGYCTVLRKDYEVWNAWTKPQIYFSMANNSIGIVIPIDIKYSYSAIYNYLSNNGENEVVIYYQLETPTETPITLPNLPTFKGTSIISADTTIQPSNTEIEYYSNVKE